MVNFNEPTPPQPSFYPTQTYEPYPERSTSQHLEGSPHHMRLAPPALLYSRGANMRRHDSNRHDRIDYYGEASELSSQQNSLTPFWKGWITGISNFFKGCFKSSRELTIDSDLEMERERYRYIREAHAELDGGNEMSGLGERGSSDPRDPDFPPAETMESLEGSPVISYGTSVPPAEDIEDTSEVFALNKREFNRMSEQRGTDADTQESTQGVKIIKSAALHDQNVHDEDTDAPAMKPKMVQALPEDWNSGDLCEAPVIEKKKTKASSSSKGDAQNAMEHAVQEAKAKARASGSKPGERIRFSRREKKAAGRRAKGDDPVLNYRWDGCGTEEGMEDMTTSMLADVDKLHRMLDCESTYRENLADLGRDVGAEAGGRVRLVEEVQSFVDDVTKAAEDMTRATKRRSDLFIERIRVMELADVPRQEVEFESLLKKVAECEKINAELRESIVRAKERGVVKDVVEVGVDE